jgi:heme exporter protein A
MILEIISISLLRNNKRIFKNFSLSLRKSQIASLIGKNGSGKTSLLDMIVGLISPNSGTIKIDGCDINEIGEEKKFKFVYLPFIDAFKENLSVQDNIKIWGKLSSLKFNQKTLEKKLEYFELLQLRDTYVGKLSQGQRKRVSLVKLLLSNCKLWLLDEPFNSLDKENMKKLKTLFLKHKADGGSVLLASHIEMDFKKTKKIFIKSKKNIFKVDNNSNTWDSLG